MEKQKLPGANSSLILGICSIVTACCCYGLPGMILGIIGLNKAKKANLEFAENSELYTGNGNANTGKITSIIGIALNGLVIIYLIFIVSTGRWAAQMDEIRSLIEQAQ